MRLRRDCKKFRKLRISWQDATVGPENLRRMDEHLESCELCRAFDHSLAESRGALRHAAIEPITPSEFTSNLLLRITGDRLRRQLAAWRPALIGAVSSVVLLSTVVQLLTKAPEINQPNAGSSAWDIQRTESGSPVFITPPDSYDTPTRVDV